MLGLTVDAVANEDGETVLELDITTNRPDCLSHYGVARELAARYGKQLPAFGSTSGSKPRVRRKHSVVEIVADDLCRRYSARLIRDVKVGPSPGWLARRLELAGVRSINNVADATNYALIAYGHPLHAFDLDLLDGGRIIVRRAGDRENLKTLDGVERTLTPDDLVIADASRAVALAGIMGGQETEISERTQNVLLESAWFEPVSIRRTAKRQGMHTEASHRFERGADIGATLAAANACADLIQELAGGTLDQIEIDAYPRPVSLKVIPLRRAEISRHLGLSIPAEDVSGILSRLGFSPQQAGQKGWKATAPTFRVDITREIDLVEEVARHYGYDKFPLRLPGMETGEPARKPPHAVKEFRLREMCLALGYNETISAVMVSKETEVFGEQAPVALSNPLSEEGAVLRTSMVPGLLDALQWNLNRGSENVALFEFGHIYTRDADTFREPARLALAVTGDRLGGGLGQPSKAVDFFDVKGDLEQILEMFEIGDARFEAGALPDYYRPGHGARVVAGTAVAQFGELLTPDSGRWKFRRPVFLAEIFLDSLYARTLREPHFEAISRYPAVERDFSILLPEQTRFEQVQQAVQLLEVPELVSARPVEIFRGGSLPAGRFSLLLRVTLQSQSHTLTEAELADFSARIMRALEEKLGAQIRA